LVEAARHEYEDEYKKQLLKDRARIAAEEAGKAGRKVANDMREKDVEIAEFKELLKQSSEKLAEAKKAELRIVRKERELEQARSEVTLTIEKKVQEETAAVQREAREKAEEEFRLKIQEGEEQRKSLLKQLDDVKRKGEQGSQRLQGEVLELDLEAQLKAKFPTDTIEPVAKGVHGADVLQHVRGVTGQTCGTIIWEAKRAKSWSESWLAKLREDQRSAKAEVAVIVSVVLPEDVKVFELRDGVCITGPSNAMAVASLMRASLMEVGLARQASEGQTSKMAMVYQYITSPAFRQRIQAVVESFSAMQEDLGREQKVMNKQWAKREQQIHRIMEASVGIYGDLQGITGKTLKEIDATMLEEGTTSITA
jgi:hypothetical protein